MNKPFLFQKKKTLGKRKMMEGIMFLIIEKKFLD